MKAIKYSSLIVLTLLLTACNNAKSEYETPDKEAQATGVSTEIFSSQKVDETISEEEMDSNIKKYWIRLTRWRKILQKLVREMG